MTFDELCEDAAASHDGTEWLEDDAFILGNHPHTVRQGLAAYLCQVVLYQLYGSGPMTKNLNPVAWPFGQDLDEGWAEDHEKEILQIFFTPRWAWALLILHLWDEHWSQEQLAQAIGTVQAYERRKQNGWREDG